MTIPPGVEMYSHEWWLIAKDRFNLRSEYESVVRQLACDLQCGSIFDAKTIHDTIRENQNEFLPIGEIE
jgi:hypothetical protein